jgi:hypothetical protein
MAYQHIEIESTQNSYNNYPVCGDIFHSISTDQHTTLLLCDGKGHGIKANIAANMNTSFLSSLLSSDVSTRSALDKLNYFFQQTGKDSNNYSAFAIARIFNDGMINILSYSIPSPIFISQNFVSVLSGRSIETDTGTFFESNGFIKNCEGVLLMSDGVCQAGIGRTNE